MSTSSAADRELSEVAAPLSILMYVLSASLPPVAAPPASRPSAPGPSEMDEPVCQRARRFPDCVAVISSG